MRFYTQFKIFHPISGKVPNHPFSYLPDIAWRARALLKNRTVEQIVSIAESVAWQIDEYFRVVKEEEIKRLQRVIHQPRNYKNESNKDEYEYICAQYYFDWIGDHYSDNYNDGEWVFNPDREEDLDIPTEGSTSEVDAFKECADYWDDVCKGAELADDCKPYELFAVQALWLLADAANYLDPHSMNENMDQATRELDKVVRKMGVKTIGSNNNLSIAGCEALKAMDAVCYAEHLREVERMRTAHRVELTKTQEDYLNEKAKQDEEEKKLRKERSEQLNQQRHKKRNEAKALVTAEWIKQPDKFPSGEQAGLYFADWLQKKGIEFQPRAVTGWIREAAKERGIRFR